MAIQMGIGKLGFNNLIYKRKFRWTFAVFDICGNLSVPADYVKLAGRPNLEIEETEINRLHGKRYIPGRGTWQTISVTYYDVASIDTAPLYTWLASVYNFVDSPVQHNQGSQSKDYAGNGAITLYDGGGNLLEAWALYDIWPQAVNFGELDYSSSEECTIECTMRFQFAQWFPFCPTMAITPCFTACQQPPSQVITGNGSQTFNNPIQDTGPLNLLNPILGNPNSQITIQP